ncbi:MAG: NADPH-dependent glutamate synthase [Fervidobacterium sp.]|uniref:Sulfide dehydrogenase (Flavoprotein) subunit SudA n=1 Tax=Fervidobacterium gondwanense DSM 13020 TaxID=1121883 RepID=A0A1M7S4S4_FERGO|nr:NADPH-dependent glutamate synthase [Fervidobacterium gondwanense]UXF00782.1 dihydropyrimidine dehydrogenase [Fervidobacterium riparium]SHN53292.1 sulfide dehydrogenase (flavoprotein) subunit SudA [Fervidobacterium gondwanense DSM 13020]
MAVKDRIEVRELEPEERHHTFSEVSLGYTYEMAQEEAKRCLQCKVPTCISGCPVGIDIPGFIREIVKGNLDRSFKILKSYNYLPAICGRVCPQEIQCEGVCVLNKIGKPINIGALERFVADWARENNVNNLTDEESSNTSNAQKDYVDKKVAVIGSGPAGLTVASELGKLGISVDIYEALHEFGGVLVYGIPEFRLPKKIVGKEISHLEALGVNFIKNIPVGYAISPKELLEKYDALFVGVGAGTPKFMGIPGSELNGVYSANEFLTRVNLMRAYKFPEYDTPIRIGKRVVVVGGGNTAMDAARSALRLGAHVTVVYRRTESEMPARKAEIAHAKEEGIEFMYLSTPVTYIGDAHGNLVAIECVRMQLSEPDESGRRKPVIIPNSNFVIEADTVIEAIGTEANKFLLNQFPDLKTNKYGYIVTNEMGQTSIPKVFAGGDIVTGSATVILAMGAGKTATRGIAEFLKS